MEGVGNGYVDVGGSGFVGGDDIHYGVGSGAVGVVVVKVWEVDVLLSGVAVVLEPFG